MKKLFLSIAILSFYTYPAAWDAKFNTLLYDQKPDELVDEPVINSSSRATLYEQILTKFTKDRFFKELEQIRKIKPRLSDPKALIKLAYAKIKEQSGESSEGLIAPYYFGLSIQDLINHNLIPNPERRHILDLANMYINNLDGLQDIPNVQIIQELFLNNNQLKDIPLNAFTGLGGLFELDLSNNQLQTITPKAFADLVNLDTLRLKNNKLEVIKPDTFTNLISLKILNLSDNQLQTIQPNTFAELNRLATIYLNNNHITNHEEQNRIKAEIQAQNPMARINFDNQTPVPTPSSSSEQTAKRGRESISSGSSLSSNREKRGRTARSSINPMPAQLPSSPSSGLSPSSSSSSSLADDAEPSDLPPADPFSWLNDNE